MLEAKALASHHIAAKLMEIPATTETETVLHQDATTKFHRRLESFQVTSSQEVPLSIGLAEAARRDAEAYFQTFQGVVSDLADSMSSPNLRDINRAKIITSIKENYPQKKGKPFSTQLSLRASCTSLQTLVQLFEDAVVEGKTPALMQREASGCFRLARTAAIKYSQKEVVTKQEVELYGRHT
ncbi:hypothetical protein BgiBS90_010532 [Biomphalaria glabrata]|nr:hypothetical protein BgiBS90_010532 [Biomphalaria glabrata]